MKWKLTSENLESQKGRLLLRVRQNHWEFVINETDFQRQNSTRIPNHIVFSWVHLVAWASLPQTCHLCPCTRRGGWKKQSRSWWSSEQPRKVAEGGDSQRKPARWGQIRDFPGKNTGHFLPQRCKRKWKWSHSVVSDSLGTHGLHHTRLSCSSLSPGVCSNSCPLSWWWHSTVSLSIVPFPFYFSVSQYQGLLQWVGSSIQVAKVLKLQLHQQHQSLQWIFKIDFLWARNLQQSLGIEALQSLLAQKL